MEKVKKREDNLEEGIANVTEELKKGNHEDTFGELEKIVERLIEQKTRVATGYDNWQNRGIFITPDSVNLAPDNFYFEIDKHIKENLYKN